MAGRLKVLLSAYACEPGKGSEPEVGWQWALQAARFHDVTVLTRENNRENIERGLGALPSDIARPEFVFHDEPAAILTIKRLATAPRWYYRRWQRSAHGVIAKLHAERRFDVMHHVTYVAFRYGTAIWGHGAPTVWGPIGGAELIPANLLPWSHPRELIEEGLRNVLTRSQLSSLSPLAGRAKASTIVLAATPEMQTALAALGCKSRLLPAIGIDMGGASGPAPFSQTGPLRLLFVGKLVYWKGLTLAIEALARADVDATLTVLGDGPLRSAANALAKRLGLADRVRLLGRRPQAEALAAYADHDALLYPSLHDSGAFTVLESMRAGRPVICVDCGGPGLAVQEGCGVRVPFGTRESIVEECAAAIRAYEGDRSLIALHGAAAYAAAAREYAWERKGAELREWYASCGRGL